MPNIRKKRRPAELDRSVEEIDEVLNAAATNIDAGERQWPGMSYDHGVQDALEWVLGRSDANPMLDE